MTFQQIRQSFTDIGSHVCFVYTEIQTWPLRIMGRRELEVYIEAAFKIDRYSGILRYLRRQRKSFFRFRTAFAALLSS